MATCITIDCGTSNTRIALVKNGEILKYKKFAIGAGKTAASGSNTELMKTIKEGLDEIFAETKRTEITGIYASGMITSEFGLVTIDHVITPCGKEKLKANTQSHIFDDICDIPITFIPGVRNDFDKDDENAILDADMMRGEETEVFGLVSIMGIEGAVTVLLPGTHAKIIQLDKMGRIEKCFTAMSGELFGAIKKDTILNNCITENIAKYDTEYLGLGFETAKKIGTNAALFKTRLLKNFYKLTEDKLSAFIEGIILSSDIELLGKLSNNDKIIIGGCEPLKSSFEFLIKKYLKKEVICATEEQVRNSTVVGAISILDINK